MLIFWNPCESLSRNDSGAEFGSPVCGDMKAECGAAGLAEPVREPRALNPEGLWGPMLDAEKLETPFSQPADTRNWASGESSDGAWRGNMFRLNNSCWIEHVLKSVCVERVKAEVCVCVDWHRSADGPQTDPCPRWEDIYQLSSARPPQRRALSRPDRGLSCAASDAEQKGLIKNESVTSELIVKTQQVKSVIKWNIVFSRINMNCNFNLPCKTEVGGGGGQFNGRTDWQLWEVQVTV